jgi:hypothetical protein
VWDDENYYLVAYDEKAGIVKHYRVDKMRDMELLDQPRSEASLKQQTDLASFGKKTFGMFGGADTRVTLRCEEHLAGVVIDRFGKDISIKPLDECLGFTEGSPAGPGPAFAGFEHRLVL